MQNRQTLSKYFMNSKGVSFTSIDDNEIENLAGLQDYIFGKEQVDKMIWRKSGAGRDGKMKNTTTFRKDHEYILVGFNQEQVLNKSFEKPQWENEYGNPDNDPRGGYKAGSISRREDASNPEHDNYYTVTSPSVSHIQDSSMFLEVSLKRWIGTIEFIGEKMVMRFRL